MENSTSQSNSVLLVKDKALNRSVWWKIYFWVITFLSVNSLLGLYLVNGFGITEMISSILYVPAAVGFFGYVYSKKILNNKFWLYFLVIYFIWDIAYYFLNEVHLCMCMSRDEYLISYVKNWVFSIPEYFGLFLYSRSSYPLWNKELKSLQNTTKHLQPDPLYDSSDEKEYKKILKKVGAAFLIIGLLAIVETIYSITNNKLNYSFNLSIISIIAGILLLRCGIRTARLITWFAASIISGLIGMVSILLLIQPIRLTITQVKLNPTGALVNILITVIVFAFLYWVYRELTKKSVIVAQKNAGLQPFIPIVAFALGGIITIVHGLLLYLMLYGEVSQLAKAKAREVYGSGYEYHINQASKSGQNVSRNIVAYNDSEIISLIVRCTLDQQTNDFSRCSLRSH